MGDKMPNIFYSCNFIGVTTTMDKIMRQSRLAKKGQLTVKLKQCDILNTNKYKIKLKIQCNNEINAHFYLKAVLLSIKL